MTWLRKLHVKGACASFTRTTMFASRPFARPVMRASPLPAGRTNPCSSTVATFGSDDDHSVARVGDPLALTGALGFAVRRDPRLDLLGYWGQLLAIWAWSSLPGLADELRRDGEQQP